MPINVSRCELNDIAPMRVQFLDEMKAQFIHDKCHLYGWSDDYSLELDGKVVGYGCVWGIDQRQDRDTIFEFYVLPEYRMHHSKLMRELILVSGVTNLECQTNDPNTSKLFFENATNIEVQSILFTDQRPTSWSLSDLELVDKSDPEQLQRERKLELLRGNEVVASGGFLMNYNFPYADIYMEVPEPYRRQGFGSRLVQEAKRLAYEIGRVPAARCNVSNPVSKATLTRAGFQPCGYWLVGKTKK